MPPFRPKRRRPHPDPQVENILQRILAVQRRAAVKADQISDYQEKITQVYGTARTLAVALALDSDVDRRRDIKGQIEQCDRRAASLQQEIRQLEQDIDSAHEEIATHQAKLTRADLEHL